MPAVSEPCSRGSTLPPLVLLPALSDFSPLPWAASAARRKRGLQISEVFQSVLHRGSPGSSWGPQPLPVPPTQAGTPGAQITHRLQGASHFLRAASLLPLSLGPHLPLLPTHLGRGSSCCNIRFMTSAEFACLIYLYSPGCFTWYLVGEGERLKTKLLPFSC